MTVSLDILDSEPNRTANQKLSIVIFLSPPLPLSPFYLKCYSEEINISEEKNVRNIVNLWLIIFITITIFPFFIAFFISPFQEVTKKKFPSFYSRPKTVLRFQDKPKD